MDKEGKKCTICGIYKTNDEFYPNEKGINKRQSHCKNCHYKCFDKIRMDKQKRKNKRTNTYREKVYGITEWDIASILLLQNDKCAICLCPIDDTDCVDHIKGTQIVRGILCNSCNRAIGLLHHNPDFLERAVVYLNKYKGE